MTEGMVKKTQYVKIELEKDKSFNLGRNLDDGTRLKYQALLNKYKDTFAWSHHDLKGIPTSLGEHRIELVEGAIPIRQRQYRLNPNYSLMVKIELDKLREAGFIYPVFSSE